MTNELKYENVSLSIQLLQPELLIKSTLIEILKSRCVSGDLTSWDKEKLVDLYRRVVLPLPQRIITSEWRRNTQKTNTKCKISGPDSKNDRSYKIGFNGVTPPKSSDSSPSTDMKKDRLKPPPGGSSQGNKKFKISYDDEANQSNKTSSSCTSEQKTPSSAKVALKRPVSQVKECQSTPSKIVCTMKPITEDKKQRSKITWP